MMYENTKINRSLFFYQSYRKRYIKNISYIGSKVDTGAK